MTEAIMEARKKIIPHRLCEFQCATIIYSKAKGNNGIAIAANTIIGNALMPPLINT